MTQPELNIGTGGIVPVPKKGRISQLGFNRQVSFENFAVVVIILGPGYLQGKLSVGETGKKDRQLHTEEAHTDVFMPEVMLQPRSGASFADAAPAR